MEIDNCYSLNYLKSKSFIGILIQIVTQGRETQDFIAKILKYIGSRFIFCNLGVLEQPQVGFDPFLFSQRAQTQIFI